MTRPLRILIPGGFYHVTCRGNDRRAIFKDDRDRIVFLEKLQGSLTTYQVKIPGYGNKGQVEIGQTIGGLDYSTVSRERKRLREKMQIDKQLARAVSQIEERLRLK